MSLYTGNNIIITEFIDNVFNIQLGSAASLCSLFQSVQLLCLSAVDADADNFIVKILLQPGNDSGSIQTAGISQNYFFLHDKILRFIVCMMPGAKALKMRCAKHEAICKYQMPGSCVTL